MGHWTDALQKSENFGKNLEQVIPSEIILKDYVQLQLPEHNLPGEDETKKLNRIREAAFNNYLDSNVRKDRAEKYAKENYKVNGFTLDPRNEPLFIPYMETEEEIKKYLDGYLGENISGKDRTQKYLESFKKMILNAGNNELLDPDQSDEKLAQNFGKIYNLFGAGLTSRVQLMASIDNAVKSGAISADAAKDLKDLMPQYDALFEKMTGLVTRMNNILSPLYPYIGSSKLPLSEAKKLADTQDIPEKFRDDEGEPLYAIFQYQSDYDTMVNQGDGLFKDTHPELFNRETFQGFSTERGDINPNNVLFESSFVFLKDPGTQSWKKYTRNPNGLFTEQNMTDEEAVRAPKIYAAMSNKENRDFVTAMNIPTGHAVNCKDGSTIPGQIDNQIRWRELVSRGGIYYQREDDNSIHFSSLNLDQGNITDKVLLPEEWNEKLQEFSSEYLKNKGIEPTEARVKICNVPRIGNTKVGYTALRSIAEELRDGLRAHDSRADISYKNVETALNDYISVSGQLSGEENIIMLQRIENLAQIYLDGNHNADRMKAMNDAAGKLRNYTEALNDLYRAGIMDDKSGAALENEELLLRTLRRSMRNRPFDADAFSLWKAVNDHANSREEMKNIRSSEAVGFMKTILHDVPVKDEKELDLIYRTAKAGLDIANSYRNNPVLNGNRADKDRAVRRAVREIRNFRGTGNAVFDQALKYRMYSELEAAAGENYLDRNPYMRNRNDQFQTAVEKNRQFEELQNFSAFIDYSEMKALSDTKRIVDTKNDEYIRQFSYALFGTGAQFMNKVCDDLNMPGERAVPFTLFVSLLLDKGMSLEDVLDPGKGQEAKRAFGREILEDLSKKAGDRKYNKAFIIRSLAKHNEELNNYVAEQYTKFTEGRISAEEWGEAADILADGVFDVYCQKLQINYTEEQRIEAFRNNNETTEQARDRMFTLYHQSDQLNSIINGKTRSLWTNADGFIRSLSSMDSEAGGGLKSYAITHFGLQNFAPQADILKKIYGDHSYDANIVIKYTPGHINNVMNTLIGDLDNPELYTLLLKEKNRVRIEYNADYIKNIKENNKNANISDIKNMAENYFKIVLTDRTGKEQTISPEMLLTGQPVSAEERDFLKNFKMELSVLASAQKQTMTDRQTDQWEQEIGSLPEVMQDYRKMFGDFPREMRLMFDGLQRFSENVSLRSGKDVNPYDYIAIGDKTASELLNKEIQRLGLAPADVNERRQRMILSGICASALKNGRKVTGVSQRNRKISQLDEELRITNFHLPASLYIAKKNQNVFTNLWKKIKNFFTAARNVDEEKAAHEQLVKELGAGLHKTMKTKYMELYPEMDMKEGDINKELEETAKIIDTFKGMNTPRAKQGFRFVNKLNLSRDTAILAIAHGMKNGLREKFTTSGEPEKRRQQIEILKKAAKEYDRLQKMLDGDYTGAESYMRKYILKGIKNMSAENPVIDNNRVDDMGKYAARYAADLVTQQNLLHFVTKDTANMGSKKDYRPLMSWVDDVCSERDLTAIYYLNASLKMERVFQDVNVAKNLDDAVDMFAKYNYLSQKVKPESAGKRLKMNELTDYNNKADIFKKALKEHLKIHSMQEAKKDPIKARMMSSAYGSVLNKIQKIMVSPDLICKQVKDYHNQKVQEAREARNVPAQPAPGVRAGNAV